MISAFPFYPVTCRAKHSSISKGVLCWRTLCLLFLDAYRSCACVWIYSSSYDDL